MSKQSIIASELIDTTVNKEQKNSEDVIAEKIAAMITEVGEDLSRPGLIKTPLRAAKAFQFNTQGYNQSLEDVINDAVFPSSNDEMVLVKDIEFYSCCEHHLVPFFGTCHVGYIPNQQVLGLSKVARIVDMYARRLQIQEDLTMQIANAIQESTDAKGVGVIMNAQHLCMMMRGVQKQGSSTTTSCNLGLFRSDARTRSEFLSLVNG